MGSEMCIRDRHIVNVAKSTVLTQVPDKQYKWVHYNLERMSRGEIDYLEQLPKYSCFYADGWAYLLTHQYVAGKDSTVYGDL